MEPSSYLDYIERLKKQNRYETDSALKRENKKTIRHLHAELRKNTKHRAPAYALIRFVLGLGVVLLLIEAALLGLGTVFGYANTIQMAGVAARVFGAVALVVLVVRGFISPEAFADLFGKVLGGFSSLADSFKKKGNSDDAPFLPTPPKPDSLPAPSVAFDEDPPSPPTASEVTIRKSDNYKR
jgi:hypothetical protein